MRKIFFLALCFVMLSAVAVRAEGLSIVVFDLQKVATESDVLKAGTAAVEGQFKAEKDALEKDQADIEKKRKDFAAKAPTEKQIKDLQKQENAYNEKLRAFMQLYQKAEQRIREDVYTVLTSAAKSLAVKKGYTLVLDFGAVPYADPKLDVTNDMLTEANEVWKNSQK